MTVPAATRAALPLADECCAPLLRAPLTTGQAADLARTLKALADPARLRLVSMVAAHEGGEACVCDLTEPLGLTQPTVSHHLKILVDAGIFRRDKRGVWAYYALRPEALQALAAILAGPFPASAGPPGAGPAGRLLYLDVLAVERLAGAVAGKADPEEPARASHGSGLRPVRSQWDGGADAHP